MASKTCYAKRICGINVSDRYWEAGVNFASDNWAGAHERIARALLNSAAGFDPAYGTGSLDQAAASKFNEIFESEVAPFFVATGTAANALAVSAAARPGGIIYCHEHAHLIADEAGAGEYLSGGCRLQGMGGADGKIDIALLREAITLYPPDFVHRGQSVAVSISQPTEAGTLYSLAEIAEIARLCSDNGLALHMDGARFANALVALDTTARELASNVDMLSFGATKNGCWCAEALIFRDGDLARQFPFLRKRAGQLHSKSRFIAAQFLAYFENDLWLENARHANAMATRLAEYITESGQIRLLRRPEVNIIFAAADASFLAQLRGNGAMFHEFPTERVESGETAIRLVTSFATTPEEVDRFGDLVK